MRFEAANAAREFADPEALRFLHELVEDTDPEVAMAAIRAIGGIGGAMARKLLHRYSDRGEGPVSEAAAEALSTLEMDEADFSMMAVEEDR
jgi:HEAT repeat protein